MGQEQKSVQNTQEMLVGILAVATAMVPILKDGVQATDAFAIYQKFQADPVFSAKVLAAYNGVNEIGAEAADLSLAEVVQLLTTAAPELVKLVNAIRGK